MANDVSITIGADGSKARSELKSVGDTAEKSTGHLGKMGGALADIGKIAGGILLAKAFDAGTSAIKGAFTAAIDFQKMQAATAAVIESTGGKAGITAKAVTDMANRFEKLTAIDDQVIQGGENLLLTFTNIGKDVFPKATMAMLNMSTALKQDVSTSAVQLGKALNDPIKGISALSRVGVTFTQEQKDTIKTMVEMGDVAGAQGVILKELETEFGGAAKAAGQTLGGQLSLLKDTVSDTFRDMAIKALPVLLKFATIAADLLPKALDAAGTAIMAVYTATKPLLELAWEKIKDAAAWVADLAVAAADLVKLAWDKIEGPLKNLVGFAWDKLQAGAEAVKLLVGYLKDLTQLAAPKVLDAIRGFAASDAMQKLSGQAQDLATKFRGVDSESFAAGFKKVKDALQPAYDVLAPLAQKILVDLKKQFDEVAKALGPLLDSLKPLLPALEPLAKMLGTVLVAAIALLLIQLDILIKVMTFTIVAAIKTMTVAIETITTVVKAVSKVIESWDLAEKFSAVFDAVKKIVFGIIPDMVFAGESMIKGIWRGVENMWDKFVGFFVDLYNELPKWVRKAIEAASPSKVFWRIGEDIVAGLANGITDNWPKVRSVTSTSIEDLTRAYQEGFGHFSETSRQALTDWTAMLVAGVESGSSFTDTAIQDMFATLRETIETRMGEVDLVTRAGLMKQLNSFRELYAMTGSVANEDVISFFDKLDTLMIAGFDKLAATTADGWMRVGGGIEIGVGGSGGAFSGGVAGAGGLSDWMKKVKPSGIPDWWDDAAYNTASDFARSGIYGEGRPGSVVSGGGMYQETINLVLDGEVVARVVRNQMARAM